MNIPFTLRPTESRLNKRSLGYFYYVVARGYAGTRFCTRVCYAVTSAVRAASPPLPLPSDKTRARAGPERAAMLCLEADP